MGEAYKAAGQAVTKKYKKTLKLDLPPVVTAILLVATIFFMIKGWYSFEKPILSVGCWIVAIICVLGIFSPRFHKGFENGYERLLKFYKKLTEFFMRHKITSFATVIISVVVLVVLMRITPTGLVPNEDTGTVFVMVDMPPGTSQERTMEVMDQVDQIIMSNPAVQYSQKIVGYSFLAGQGATYGTFIVKLKDWSERTAKTMSSDAVVGQIYGMTGQMIKDGRVVAFAPPMITGYSLTNGFEIKMQDRTGGDINQFFNIVQNFLAQLNAQPEVQMAYSTFNPTFPQYMVDIDAAKAKQAGISPSTILSTLQGYYGGMYVSNFNRFGKIYRVM
ncbi:MAG: efflux RND transporter permease subunit, partial [Muribaculaceae bacterium]|nr:efflux RND transporter permease subunit [Muribaculaceae bacterium]